MAKATIAKPLNRPNARYWFETALKIGTPKPFTPIIDAITTNLCWLLDVMKKMTVELLEWVKRLLKR